MITDATVERIAKKVESANPEWINEPWWPCSARDDAVHISGPCGTRGDDYVAIPPAPAQ